MSMIPDEHDPRPIVRDGRGIDSGTEWQGDPVLGIAGKMFVAPFLRAAMAGDPGFKAGDHRFLESTGRRGFIPAPYRARARWARVAASEPLPVAELPALQRRGHPLVRARPAKRAQRDLPG